MRNTGCVVSVISETFPISSRKSRTISDGAFRSRSGVGVGDFVDLDRMEILKGPQSTLYGKNSTAGVIAVYAREPGRELQVSGEATASNVKGAEYAGTRLARGAVSGPVCAIPCDSA